MPRHIRAVPELSVQREGLVDELAKELGSPKKIGQPILPDFISITDDPTRRADSVLVKILCTSSEQLIASTIGRPVAFSHSATIRGGSRSPADT